MTPSERAQRIVDRLFDRNSRLCFETELDRDGPVRIHTSIDGLDLGTIVVPDDADQLCTYCTSDGVEIEIVNLDFLEVK